MVWAIMVAVLTGTTIFEGWKSILWEEEEDIRNRDHRCYHHLVCLAVVVT